MLSRGAMWIVGLVLLGPSAASAQALKEVRAAKARVSAKPQTSQPLPPEVRELVRTTADPRVPQQGSSSAPRAVALIAQLRERVPVRVTDERTALLTESRIPIREMWDGRVRFSAVMQRFHSANMYSTLSHASVESDNAPGAQSIVARSRVNYGVGVQFRFSR